MTLYNLKREYEERRQALVEQLQRNPSLDPATQHQIYGAIREIENFLKTIEYQISAEQEKNINVELSRERPSPFVERTQKAVYHVARGTKKIFTHHIPGAARAAVAVPKQYFDKRREEKRLREEIEREIKTRAQLQTNDHVTLEHPHQELAVEAAPTPLPPPSPEAILPPRTINSHVKRAKVVEKPSKGKARPSRKLKKTGQHKPHHKGRRFRR